MGGGSRHRFKSVDSSDEEITRRLFCGVLRTNIACSLPRLRVAGHHRRETQGVCKFVVCSLKRFRTELNIPQVVTVMQSSFEADNAMFTCSYGMGSITTHSSTVVICLRRRCHQTSSSNAMSHALRPFSCLAACLALELLRTRLSLTSLNPLLQA